MSAQLTFMVPTKARVEETPAGDQLSVESPVGETAASALARGQFARFDDVYAQHARFVFRVLRGMGVPDAQVDDALQDVFLVVHQRLADFDQRARVTTWLFQIALRVAAAHRRKGRRSLDHAALGEELAAKGRSPLEDVEASQELSRLTQLLGELDDDKRALLVLAELEELTAPEIAALTNTPLNTVYTRLRRARTAFVSLWHKRGERP